jgi:hypothetical protein
MASLPGMYQNGFSHSALSYSDFSLVWNHLRLLCPHARIPAGINWSVLVEEFQHPYKQEKYHKITIVLNKEHRP